MGLSRSRTITLTISLLTLTSNFLSLLLCYQLPSDPLNLAFNFSIYLHFANVLSVFGFIGALRKHALSIALFSHYLILDTILCSIPRFLVLALLHSLSDQLCAAPPHSPTSPISSSQPSQIPNFSSNLNTSPLISNSIYTPSINIEVPTLSCERVVVLVELILVFGLVGGTILQFVGALQVREYARVLWLREGAWEMEGAEEEGMSGGDRHGRFVEVDGVRFGMRELEGEEDRVCALSVIYEDVAEEGEGDAVRDISPPVYRPRKV